MSADRFNYDVLNHTDLTRSSGKSGEINLETLNWGNYDLIVIDESHNFRNNNLRKEGATRYSRLMNDVIKSGVKTKVLMLSATPVNSRMNDLKNQVSFIAEGIDDAFSEQGIASIEQTLKKAQTRFNQWLGLDEQERKVEVLLERMNFDYFKLLDLLTIARSRKHIEKYYDIAEIGAFPERLKPLNIKADIDGDGDFPPLKDINQSIRKLHLSAYAPLKYVRMEKREEYSRKYDMKVGNGSSVFKQVDREQSLIHLIRINLLKRMESSINSFALTLSKLLREVDYLIDKIDSHEGDTIEEVSIEDIEIEDQDFESYLIGRKVKVLIQDIDAIRWKQDLEEDRQRLATMLNEASLIEPKRDAKLQLLKDVISHKCQNPVNPDNKKLLVFTAFADTANYLYENLAQWAQTEHRLHAALVTGTGTNKTTLSGINKDLNSILTTFSPVSKERHKIDANATDEIDLLIATDCISEGQNLQDCDYLINYDIHWNPVRIIQRFGRIDRLGSKNDFIQLINFWPNMELDEYINLEARVSGRMVLLDISATGEENIIEYDDKKRMNDLDYRRKQLQQLQSDVVNLEDMTGGVSITDLTLNDFKMDLSADSFELLVATGNGQVDLDRHDYANSIMRLQPGLQFDSGCDEQLCQNFNPVNPDLACMESCKNLFIPRLAEGNPPLKPANNECDNKTFWECLAWMDFDLGGSAPIQFNLKSGKAVIVQAGKDGAVYLIDADHLGTQYDRLPIVDLCGTPTDACKASWMGMIVTHPVLTYINQEPVIIIPTFVPDQSHPAGLVALKIFEESGKPKFKPFWAFPDRSTIEAVASFRSHPSLPVMSDYGKRKDGILWIVDIATHGVLYGIRVMDGSLAVKQTLLGTGRPLAAPLIYNNILYLASSISTTGKAFIEAYQIRAQP